MFPFGRGEVSVRRGGRTRSLALPDERANYSGLDREGSHPALFLFKVKPYSLRSYGLTLNAEREGFPPISAQIAKRLSGLGGPAQSLCDMSGDERGAFKFCTIFKIFKNKNFSARSSTDRATAF